LHSTFCQVNILKVFTLFQLDHGKIWQILLKFMRLAFVDSLNTNVSHVKIAFLLIFERLKIINVYTRSNEPRQSCIKWPVFNSTSPARKWLSLMLMRKTQFLQQKTKNSFCIKLLVNVGFMLVSNWLWCLCPFGFMIMKISLLDLALTLMFTRTRAVFDFFECAHRLLHRTL